MFFRGPLSAIEIPFIRKEMGICFVWFGLVSWHVNHYRLRNAKSIFIQINSSISNNSVEHEYIFYTQLNAKIVLFQTIQFSISTPFRCQKQFYFNQFSIDIVQFFVYAQLLIKIVNFTLRFSVITV